jgi:hypothetical protein
MLLQKVRFPEQSPTYSSDQSPWVEAHYLQTMPVLKLLLALDVE